MPEFLKLLPPDQARTLWLAHLTGPRPPAEMLETRLAEGRVTAQPVVAGQALPEFPRSSVDGYAVRARDTYGAADSLPAYLQWVGEIPMGDEARLSLDPGQCALIHTGGMLPAGADAVVMLENSQAAHAAEIEIFRPVAAGENVIQTGEDVTAGQTVIRGGVRLRPAEIGGLMALGQLQLQVVQKVRVGLISSGDEVVGPERRPRRGQVRDVNAYSLAALVRRSGGEPVFYGIVGDDEVALRGLAARALDEFDMLVISAGSSASARDSTAAVIAALGAPGVLVHGINTRPGKPTILGVCDGKAVIGLPGNPVSALVNGYLFLVPVIEALLGLPPDRPRPSVMARLRVNIASQAGREDWIPVQLLSAGLAAQNAGEVQWLAEPLFGKSNLIFTLVAADGLLRIPADVTGLQAGEVREIRLL